MSLLAFTGNRFLAELALRDTLQARGIAQGNLPRLSGEEVTPQALEPLLSPGLFGGGGAIVDLEGLKVEKALLETLAAAGPDVTVAVLDPGAPPHAPAFTRQRASICLRRPRSARLTLWGG
ncbi:hypothetical protein ACFP81_04320 [Deinococcus lacus]|uniref:Uncharacterized protein n=1 Tax=Deinococcus lacus TaxID=392561 RepID=A0ABW1YAI2_9DEIO